MLAALDQQDLETVATLGHNMAGSGGSFGFPAISTFGAAIQQTAEASNPAAARAEIEALVLFLSGAGTVAPR